MKNTIQVAVSLIFVTAALITDARMRAAPPPGQGAVPALYAITEVQAKLYYSNKGTFSQNVLDNPSVSLWNVIIGEGSAGGSSENTLVHVVVMGQPGSLAEGLALHVTAKTPTETLLDRRSQVGIMNTNGRYYAGFWLYGTGCEPVELWASPTFVDDLVTLPESAAHTLPG